MSSRRRKREMWMWWLTPTCSTLLYYTGKRERRRRKKMQRERERGENYERVTCVCVQSLSLSLSLSSTWMVGGLFSLFVEFFFLKVSPIHKKKVTSMHKFFFLLFAWWTLNYFTLSHARAFARSRCYDYINNSFDQWEELKKKEKRKKTVDRWE